MVISGTDHEKIPPGQGNSQLSAKPGEGKAVLLCLPDLIAVAVLENPVVASVHGVVHDSRGGLMDVAFIHQPLPFPDAALHKQPTHGSQIPGGAEQTGGTPGDTVGCFDHSGSLEGSHFVKELFPEIGEHRFSCQLVHQFRQYGGTGTVVGKERAGRIHPIGLAKIDPGLIRIRIGEPPTALLDSGAHGEHVFNRLLFEKCPSFTGQLFRKIVKDSVRELQFALFL